MFCLEGVHSQSDDACQRIERIQSLRLEYFDHFAKERTRKKLEALIDYLISSPITSISQAQDTLNSGSFTTIQRLIE
ncbi:MAG: hypothetical protein JEZ06_17405 [Anaerolineaceae bacterium]|nr:hypothetical protein [Anaerolineaceae bacterium]